MSENKMFNTVRFGGFDKEEVLDFISETLANSEKKEKENQAKLQEMQEKMELQAQQIELLKKQLSLNSGDSTAGHQEQAVGKAIMKSQEISEQMLDETRARCQKMTDEALTYQKSLSINGPELLDVQQRYREVCLSVTKLNDILALLEKKLHEVNTSLKAFQPK